MIMIDESRVRDAARQARGACRMAAAAKLHAEQAITDVQAELNFGASPCTRDRERLDTFLRELKAMQELLETACYRLPHYEEFMHFSAKENQG